MQSILDAINEWIKEILIGSIQGNLEALFGDVNEKVGTIAAEVGKTPQGWNGSVFSMIKTLSENVIVPIAGLVITYVLCYDFLGTNVLLAQKKVSGIVKEADTNESLIGATIVMKGTTNGVITDLDGHYAIEVNANEVLQFAYVDLECK